MSEGWICPRCGRALAPWMSECPCYLAITVSTSTMQITQSNNENGEELHPIWDGLATIMEEDEE